MKAGTHLTSACYTSFRKRVEATGCKAKRREATAEERLKSGDKRKGKLYVISVTCPVHPSRAAEAKAKAQEAADARKAKAKAAAERKAEKERKEREERERLAAAQRARVREEYASIVGVGEESARRKTTSKSPKTESETAAAAASAQNTTCSGGGMATFVKVGDVTTASLLNHARSVHEDRLSSIRSSVHKEESDLMAKLRKKHAEEEKELRGTMRDEAYAVDRRGWQ